MSDLTARRFRGTVPDFFDSVTTLSEMRSSAWPLPSRARWRRAHAAESRLPRLVRRRRWLCLKRQRLGQGRVPCISLRCTDTARALPPDMRLRRLGWSLGSKRSRRKPQSHDHGNDSVSNSVSTARGEAALPGQEWRFRIRKSGGPEGIRTPDLLNAMHTVDRPPASTRVVFEFKPDSDYRRSVHQSPPESTR